MLRILGSVFSLVIVLFVLSSPLIGQEDLIAVKTVPSPITRPVATGATVRGRVIYADTSRPVRFAGLNLVRDETRTVGSGNGSGSGGGFVTAGRMSNAKTDENGEFVVQNVQPGTYSVEMSGAGFLTKSSFFRGPGVTDSKAMSEFFESFDVAGVGETQVLVRVTRAGSISGKITYSDGEVAVGLRVEALRKTDSVFNSNMGAYGSGFTTDDRGQYRITGLAPGEYVVRVIEPYRHNSETPAYYSSLPESTTLRTYYPEGERADQAKTIQVNLGEEALGIDISVPERTLFVVTGRVISKTTRRPLEGFTVRFASMNPQDRNVREFGSAGNEATSDAAGDWELRNIPKGKYLLIVSERPRYDREQSEKPKERFGTARKEIEITDKNLDRIEIEVGAESSVSGVVVDEKGAPFESSMGVILIDDANRRSFYPEYRNIRPNADKSVVDSSIRFGKVEPGQYRVVAATQQFYVVSATLNDANVASGTFEVKEGEAVKGLTIVVSTAMGTVKGRVENLEGIAGYRAQLIRPGAKFEAVIGASGLVAPNGDFSIRVAPGSYQLVLFPPQILLPRDAEAMRRFTEDLMRSAVPVTVAAGQSVSVSVQKP